MLIRPFDPSNHLAIVIVTLSLFLMLNAIAGVIWAFDGRAFPSLFPGRNKGFTILGAQIEWADLGTWLTVLAAVFLVTLLLRKTKIGLAFRSVSSSLESSQLLGIHIGRTLQFGWALAAAMGTLAGSLVARTTLIEPNFMGRVLIYSFAAATLGGLDSLGGAVLAGIIIGLVQTMGGGYVDAIGSELAPAVALAVIVVILVVRPSGSVRLEADRARLMALVTLRQGSPGHRAYVIGAWVLVALGILYVVFAHSLPVTLFSLDKGFRVSQINDVVAYAVAILGLNLVIGFSGQLSLGQSAFVGLGAYTTIVLVSDHHWSYLRHDARCRPPSASSSVCSSVCRRCGSGASTWPSSRWRSPTSSRTLVAQVRVDHRRPERQEARPRDRRDGAAVVDAVRRRRAASPNRCGSSASWS